MEVKDAYLISDYNKIEVRILDPKDDPPGTSCTFILDIPSIVLKKKVASLFTPGAEELAISAVLQELHRLMKLHKCSQRVFDWLVSRMRNDGTVIVYSQQMIADETGLSVRTVRNAIHELSTLGYVRRVKYGLYRVSDGIHNFIKEARGRGKSLGSGIFIWFGNM